MGGHGPGDHRLGRAVQGAEARWLPSRSEPGDALARCGHPGGIDTAELGRHEKSAARGRVDLDEGLHHVLTKKLEPKVRPSDWIIRQPKQFWRRGGDSNPRYK